MSERSFGRGIATLGAAAMLATTIGCTKPTTTAAEAPLKSETLLYDPTADRDGEYRKALCTQYGTAAKECVEDHVTYGKLLYRHLQEDLPVLRAGGIPDRWKNSYQAPAEHPGINFEYSPDQKSINAINYHGRRYVYSDQPLDVSLTGLALQDIQSFERMVEVKLKGKVPTGVELKVRFGRFISYPVKGGKQFLFDPQQTNNDLDYYEVSEDDGKTLTLDRKEGRDDSRYFLTKNDKGQSVITSDQKNTYQTKITYFSPVYNEETVDCFMYEAQYRHPDGLVLGVSFKTEDKDLAKTKNLAERLEALNTKKDEASCERDGNSIESIDRKVPMNRDKYGQYEAGYMQYDQQGRVRSVAEPRDPKYPFLNGGISFSNQKIYLIDENGKVERIVEPGKEE